MTADEMFKELGYKKSKFVSKDFIEYQHSYIYDTSIFIRFDLDELYITKYDDTDNGVKMREILFRGKTKMQVRTYNCGKKDNEWVYGHYYDKVGLPIIRQFELDRADYVEYEVDRETVGQYTGLKDKNGNRIYQEQKYEYLFATEEEAQQQKLKERGVE